MQSGRTTIVSEKADGTDRTPLATLGRVSGTRYSTQYPGGDLALTFNLERDPSSQHVALNAGRWLRVMLGCSTAWYGRLESAVVGTPWQISGTGTGALGGNAFTSSGSSTNTTVDAKISEGSVPWKRTQSLPDAVQPTLTTVLSLTDFLNQASVASNQMWSVASDGLITMAAAPTTATLMAPTTLIPGRTLDGYVTLLWGLYYNSGAGNALAVTTVNNATAEALHGRRADKVDLTQFGPMSTATAQTYMSTVLGRSGFRASFTQPFTLSAGQLLTTPGGAAMDPAAVRAGALLLPVGLDVAQGGEAVAGPLTVLIGQTDYDEDADTVDLTPYETATQSLDQQLTDLVQVAV